MEAGLAGSSRALTVQTSVLNSLDAPIEIETGCGAGPALLLHSEATGGTYRAMAATGPAGEDCHTRPVIAQPGASLLLNASYATRGYAGADGTATGIPGGLYRAETVVTYRVVTGDESQRYQKMADGHVVDTWPARWSASSPTTVSIAGAESESTVGAAAAGAAPFTPKVLVIDYNTSGMADDGTAALTRELAAALSSATRYHGASMGSAQFQIYGTYAENNAPPIVAGSGKGDGTGKGDYAAIFSKYGICNLAATQGVNFVWIWAAGTEAGGPFYAGDFFEWVTTGPTFNETYGSNVPNCGHTVVTMGLNYSRDMALAVHSHGHYMENVLGYSFGPASDAGAGGTDMYDLFDGQFYRYHGVNTPLNTTNAGCGDVHYPPNTTQAYDYWNTSAVQSRCASYNPGRPGLEHDASVSVSIWEAIPCDASITANTYDCDQESYLLWWMQNMPGARNSAVDCAQGSMPNWWQYIVALDSVAQTTANSCTRVAAVTDAPQSGVSGGTVVLTASGFSSGEPVSIFWDSMTSTPVLSIGAVNGAINTTITVPVSAVAGAHTLFVKGLSSGEIGSAPFTVQPPSGGSGNLLTDADFENGLTGWSAASLQGHALLTSAAAHSPSHSLDLCGSNSCTDSLLQTVTLPRGRLSGTLSYWVDVSTHERSPVCYDRLLVQLRTTFGAVFFSLPVVCSSNSGGWVQKTAILNSPMLSAHAGQAVQVYFLANTNPTNPTDFYVDDVALSVTAQ
jgi:hypothetical protein